MVKSNVQNVRDTKFFETGYIIIGKNIFDVEYFMSGLLKKIVDLYIGV